MAATGSRDNIKLSKMEDYSHEKLAVEFREIYDEKYTNADDELRELQNVTKVNTPENYLLQIVKVGCSLEFYTRRLLLLCGFNNRSTVCM